MKNKQLLFISLTGVIMMACTAGPNPMAATVEPLAGFWKGLWHGFIMMFTFIISIFNENVTMYEVNNNGGWYNFGFLMGAMMFWGGGGNQACTRGKSGSHDNPIQEIKNEIRDEVVSEITQKFKEDEPDKNEPS